MKKIKNFKCSTLKLVGLFAISSLSLSSCLIVPREPSRHVVVIEEQHHDNGRHNGQHKHDH